MVSAKLETVAEMSLPTAVQELALWAGAIVTIGGGAGLLWKYAVGPSGRWTLAWVKRVQELMRRIDVIYNNVTPNGGSSIIDQLAMLNTRVTFMERARELSLAVFNVGFARSDHYGNFVLVNRVLQRQTGKSDDELLGRGWYSAIDPHDRTRVVEEWHRAVHDRREFAMRFRWRHESGNEVPVYVEGWPTDNGKAEQKFNGYALAFRGMNDAVGQAPPV